MDAPALPPAADLWPRLLGALLAALVLGSASTWGLQWVSRLDLAPIEWLAALAAVLRPEQAWILVLLFNLMFLTEVAIALLLASLPAAALAGLFCRGRPTLTALLATILFLLLGAGSGVLSIVRPVYVPAAVANPAIALLTALFMVGFSRRAAQWLGRA